jgi:hypothetical protein
MKAMSAEDEAGHNHQQQVTRANYAKRRASWAPVDGAQQGCIVSRHCVWTRVFIGAVRR